MGEPRTLKRGPSLMHRPQQHLVQQGSYSARTLPPLSCRDGSTLVCYFTYPEE